MRKQTMGIGLFFIIIGVLIFLYLILLPPQYKIQLLNQIYNQTLNISNISTIQINQYYYKNIEISPDEIKLYISENQEIGSLYKAREIYLNSENIQTNIFSGNKYLYYFFYYNKTLYNGINLSFNYLCSNGVMNIYINGLKVFSGCSNSIENIYIEPGYLKNGNNMLEIEFSPTNIFENAQLTINYFNIIYDKLSYIDYMFYYTSGNVYLYYNFCPVNPNAVSLYINNVSYPLSSCSNILYNNPILLNPYLNTGINNILIQSNYPANITLYLVLKSKEFYINFPSDYDKLIIVTNGGYGDVNINDVCYYYINNSQNLYVYNLSQCLNGNTNILLISSNTGLDINMLELTR